MADAAVGGEGRRRILVAVDEGDESLHALSWCLSNLVRNGSNSDDTQSSSGSNARDTVILLYVRPPPPDYSVFDDTGYMISDAETAVMEKHSNDLARSVLEKASNIFRNFHNNIKVEAKTDKGDPRDVICEAVEKQGADMLVMGSHGYGFIKRALMGSVSNYCVQNAKCPVVIVKRPDSGQRKERE